MENWSIPKLKSELKARGIGGLTGLRKAQLVQLLFAHGQSQRVVNQIVNEHSPVLLPEVNQNLTKRPNQSQIFDANHPQNPTSLASILPTQISVEPTNNNNRPLQLRAQKPPGQWKPHFKSRTKQIRRIVVKLNKKVLSDRVDKGPAPFKMDYLHALRKMNGFRKYTDDWTIVKELGRGAYGVVDLVVDKRNGLRAVRKTIKSGTNNDFEKELSILHHLRSECGLGVICFKTFRQAGDNWHQYNNELYTDYLGENVVSLFEKDRIQKAASNLDAPARKLRLESLVDQMVSILQRIHGRRISHGDIASRNILIDLDSWKLTFIDFGGAYHSMHLFKQDWDQLKMVMFNLQYTLCPDLGRKDIQRLGQKIDHAKEYESASLKLNKTRK